jgi:hypothetical protein
MSLLKTSSNLRLKVLVFVPLSIAFAICIPQISVAQKFEQQGNGKILQGNTITMSAPERDTVMVIDPVTKDEIYQIRETYPQPIKMNGKMILNVSTSHSLEIMSSDDKFLRYLMNSLKQELSLLEDGRYCIAPMTIIENEKGQLAYFDRVGISKMNGTTFSSGTSQIDPTLQKIIDTKTAELIEHCPRLSIHTSKQVPMPYKLGNLIIIIKNHRAYTL